MAAKRIDIRGTVRKIGHSSALHAEHIVHSGRFWEMVTLAILYVLLALTISIFYGG